jgi:hypothetical protein
MAAESAAAAGIATGDSRPCFSDSAKIVVALAATALPFARCQFEETERWFRILRVHGAVGNAMQALGLPEEAFIAPANGVGDEPCRPDSLDTVLAAAAANLREGEAITTEDLLVGVLETYGPVFENALAIRGTTSAEVLELMATPRMDA